jgi:hypothetical protein
MSFYGPVPGDLGHPNGGTDFNGCASMFCRTVVEGRFGYRPDYPGGVVTIAPQFPADRDHASIKTPDISLTFAGSKYQIDLTQPAALKLQLPVRTKKLTAVTVNGQPARFDRRPAFGCNIVQIVVPRTNSVSVKLKTDQPVPQYSAEAMETFW